MKLYLEYAEMPLLQNQYCFFSSSFDTLRQQNRFHLSSPSDYRPHLWDMHSSDKSIHLCAPHNKSDVSWAHLFSIFNFSAFYRVVNERIKSMMSNFVRRCYISKAFTRDTLRSKWVYWGGTFCDCFSFHSHRFIKSPCIAQYPSARRIAFLSRRVYFLTWYSYLAICLAVHQYQLSFNSPNLQSWYNWKGGLYQHDSVHHCPCGSRATGLDSWPAVPSWISGRNLLRTVDNNLLPLNLMSRAFIVYYTSPILSIFHWMKRALKIIL